MQAAFWILLLLPLAGGQSREGVAAPGDWERADRATVRLPAAAYPNLPEPVREELERRGCLIPQVFTGPPPHNVVRGRFTTAERADVAVLCSWARASSILIFHGSSGALIADLAEQPDADFLQVVHSGVIGYSRSLGVASPEYIRQQRERYGGPEPPPLDHDGVEDSFVEKGSVVWYWHRDRWLRLTGSD